MNRTEIYQILDGEREYQDQLWGGHKHDNFHSVGDFMIYIDDYMRKAKDAYTNQHGKLAALDVLRKVVALGVACFEVHDVPERKLNKQL